MAPPTADEDGMMEDEEMDDLDGMDMDELDALEENSDDEDYGDGFNAAAFGGVEDFVPEDDEEGSGEDAGVDEEGIEILGEEAYAA